MTKPILYGSEMSPAVRTVFLTAAAIGLDYEFKPINVQAGENKTEEFLKKNPQHTIPTLEDNGKTIWDSHAIATYLVSKYGKDDSLCPKDLYLRAIVDQRLHFESNVLSAKIRGLTTAMRANDNEALQTARESLLEAFDFLEKFLGDNTYLVENSLTVADFSIVSSLSSVNLFAPVDPNRYPKLFAWLKRMESLPYYAKANGVGLKKVAEFIEKLRAERANKKQ